MNRNGRIIFRRELAAYFNSPIAYIFIIAFALVTSFLYMSQFFLIGQADMRSFFGLLPIILCVFLPAVTMRLWAEERRGNTLELLLTFPMQPHELVLGKFFASLMFYVVALASTFAVPVMLFVLGRPDMGPILGGYLGALLAGAFFLALGILVSGFCRDQIVALLITVMASFSFYLLGLDFIASSIDGWVAGLGSFLQNFFGMTIHYSGFERGVISVGDVLYFLIGMVVFLTLNGFWLEGRGRMGAGKIFSTAIVISLGIFIVANWLCEGLRWARVDLTAGKLYTVSDASKRILKELKASVICKVYISHQEKMPTGMKSLEQDVTDKLDELVVASGGKLSYKVFHMEAARIGDEAQAAESLEESLQQKGIQPFQVRSIEADEMGVTLVYSAISIAYKEKPEEVIPRIYPDNLPELEYLVLSKIYRLTLPEKPRVALFAPFSERNMDPQLRMLLSQLGQSMPEQYMDDRYRLVQQALEYEGYEVSRVTLAEDGPIPDGIKTLAIVQPENINERQQYEIGRFLHAGGSVFLAAQNYTFSYDPSGNRGIRLNPEETKHGLDPLLEAWGVKLNKNFLMDQENEVLSISGAAMMGPFALSVPVRAPIHVLVKSEGMNHDVSVTSRLSSFFYLWGSALSVEEEVLEKNNIALTTLLTSSDRSWEVPHHAGALTQSDIDPARFPVKANMPLAVLAEGIFPNAFEDKPVPAWPAKEPSEEGRDLENIVTDDRPLTPAAGKLIMIGCSVFLTEDFIQAGGHLPFLLNSIDALSLGEDLIEIRSKQPIDRSIPRIAAEGKIMWKMITTVVPAVVFALLWFLHVVWRRNARQQFMKSMAITS